MTREEKEQTGKYVLKMARLLEDGCYQQEMLLKAAHIIYEALEQESKIGHWIMTSDYLTTAYGSVDYVKCSCCGEDSLEEGDYCPNCGTRMVEPQESEKV